MSKYRLTILSPVHISSGEEYELNYNLLEKDGFVYLYDEFKLVEYFIANDIAIPSNLSKLKKLISGKSDDIIDSNLHQRKIESNFSNISKPMLAQITTAELPIITGSSIKGSLRTAILDCMTNHQEHCKNIIKNFKDKSFDERRFKKRFDNDLADIFKYLKVTDSLLPLETKVYKTINMKKDKQHQGTRSSRVEQIANFVEAVKPNQSFEIELDDTHEEKIFKNLTWICNNFYIPFFAKEEKQYFAKKTDAIEKAKNANKDMFIINVGRFGGAESKSLNNLRFIKASKADDKSTTSARTFALESDVNDKIYFENQLVPFGWIMCEKINKNSKEEKNSKLLVKNTVSKNRKEKHQAIENLNIIKKQKAKEAKIQVKQKQAAIEEKEKRDLEDKANEKARLKAMSPFELKINELSQEEPNTPRNTLIFNNINNGNLDNYKCEALKVLKEAMQNAKEWKENSSAKKPEKDKNYQRTLKVIQMTKKCD